MTYWDALVGTLTALSSPRAVGFYTAVSAAVAVMILMAALLAGKRRYYHSRWGWRKPAWCYVAYVLTGPYVLLAIAAVAWVMSITTPTHNAWP